MVLIDVSNTDTFTSSNGYFIHQYKVTGTRNITVIDGGVAEVLVVAGGGSGFAAENAYSPSGGGGGGEVIYLTSNLIRAGTLSVSVGAGGINSNGGNSSFGTIEANGGGRGGSASSNALSGGSGGGAGRNNLTRALSVKLNASGLGNSGGISMGGAAGAAGGGGASQQGVTVTGQPGAAGGQGYTSTITGTAQVFGSGGGGGARANAGGAGGSNAGSGGRGETADTVLVKGTNAINGFGGGGGGGGGGGNVGPTNVGTAGNGGSGIVIVKYYLGSIITSPVSLTSIKNVLNSSTNSFSSYQGVPVSYKGVFNKLPSSTIGYSNFLMRQKNIVTDGLSLFFDPSNPTSYSGSGTTLLDISGKSNNGNLEGGASVNTSNQLFLNGSPQYVSTTFQPNLDNSRLYTLELWFKDDAPGCTTPDNTALISNYSGNTTTAAHVQLHIFDTGIVRLLERNMSTTTGSASTSASVCTGKWTHIVGVATSTQLLLYVNGSNVATGTRPGGTITPSPNRNITIGGNHFDRYQTCQIGPIRIYLDKALSATEVATNYEAERYRESLNV